MSFKMDGESFVVLLITFSLFFQGGFSVNPKEAYQSLIEGNKTFVADKSSSYSKHRKQIYEQQNPIATILCCSDSRVPPEIVFQQGLGQLFVVRLAGNVVDEIGLESLRFGLITLQTPLFVILGHQNCGAVQAAIETYIQDHGQTNNPLFKEIFPSVSATEKTNITHAQWLDEAIVQNVKHTAQTILELDPQIRKKIEKGELQLVLGEYLLKSGKVAWIPFSID